MEMTILDLNFMITPQMIPYDRKLRFNNVYTEKFETTKRRTLRHFGARHEYHHFLGHGLP